MEQVATTVLYTVELNNAEAAALLLLVMGLVVAIVGSLTLLTKRNQNFISEFTSFSRISDK